MKITHKFPFTNKIDWSWSKDDRKLIQVIDHVYDIDKFIPFIENWGTCIQAGGAMGIWPIRFSQLFKKVYTFEYTNFEYLSENIKNIKNIEAIKGCLYSKHCNGLMALDESERNNSGAFYFVEGKNGEVPSYTIDSFNFKDVGLIQLDVEGAEYDVIKGALNTINHQKPVVVIEEKKLPQLKEGYEAARDLLEEIGYKTVLKVHRDIVLKC